MSILRFTSLAIVVAMLCGSTAPSRCAAGQIWEYHTRPQDAGSLLKIQEVGDFGDGKVYHLSITGVHFATPGMASTLPHIPVSETTLNASVTRLSSAHPDFPTAALQDGISEWQRAKGGVFTIPISQIIDIVDDQIGRTGAATKTPPAHS